METSAKLDKPDRCDGPFFLVSAATAGAFAAIARNERASAHDAKADPVHAVRVAIETVDRLLAALELEATFRNAIEAERDKLLRIAATPGRSKDTPPNG